MESKKNKITDLMPQVGKDLIAYTGREVITKVGADLIKDIIVSILCGENVRNLTEDLTKRRVAIINGALLTLFVKGCNNVDDFIERLPELVGDQLKMKNTKVDKDILLWLLGLTGKGVQNILRSKSDLLEGYIKKIKATNKKLITECQKSYGNLRGTLTINNTTANVDWNVIISLLNVIGTETLAIRGAEKSMYGKLFERLVLGSCLSILGFKKKEPKQDDDCNKVFWLSSRGSKRESDATALYEPGKGVRFDIGFIGPGNTEISLDKVSRFEREMEYGRQKHFMATFIIVDRIGDRSRIVELAKKIDGTIVQMSMAFWPKVLAEKLGHVLGFKHALQNMTPQRHRALYSGINGKNKYRRICLAKRLESYIWRINNKMIPCFDEETMACYIDGLLSEEEIKQVEKHIATCDRCKEIVEITRKIKNQEDTCNS